MRFIAVWNAEGSRIAGADVRLTAVGGVTDAVKANADGWAGFNTVSAPNYILNVDAAGYQPYQQTFTLPVSAYDVSVGDTGQTSPGAVLLPPMQRIGLPRLHRDGTNILRPDGTVWKMKGATDFLLYQRFLLGEDIVPLLQQRSAAGANCVRVFGQCVNVSVNTGLPAFTPAAPGWFERLPEFYSLLATYSLYGYLVIFPDNQMIRTDPIPHWTRVCDTLRPIDNVILFGQNEGVQNGLVGTNLPRPADIFCGADTSLTDGNPPLPAWDASECHVRRDYPKYLFTGTDLWWASSGYGASSDGPGFAGVHGPVWVGETVHVDEGFPAAHLARMAADSAMWGAGLIVHAQSGIGSQLWGPNQEACAVAAYKGIDLGAQV